MRWNPVSATSETYELNVSMFRSGKPEEFLNIMKNLKNAINGNRTTASAGKSLIYLPYYVENLYVN